MAPVFVDADQHLLEVQCFSVLLILPACHFEHVSAFV